MLVEIIQALSMIVTAQLILRYGIVLINDHIEGEIDKNVAVAVLGIVCALCSVLVGNIVGLFLGL